jgi:hypothetical protein
MSDAAVIAVVVGAVAIGLVVVLRKRLARLAVDLRKGRLSAAMNREKPIPQRGARLRRVRVPGNATADDGSGQGASLEDVDAGGDASAIVREPTRRRSPARRASKKK